MTRIVSACLGPVFLTRLLLASTALAGLGWSEAQAQVLPSGASVAAGSASIARTSTTLTVTQGSQSAIVDYKSFSIGKGDAVSFVQPNSAAEILNRVTGGATSVIAGTLTANGVVYLINPNGIAITPSGTVDVGGGFVASTLAISDEAFKKSQKHFYGWASPAGVSNAGVISIGRGGYAALIGGHVSNSGLIAVPLGQVALGSGERATLDVSGDGFLQVAVPTVGGGARPLVSDNGRIVAPGSAVILDAATAVSAARNAVNISGSINAQSVGGQNGNIQIGGGAGGFVGISGELSATSVTGTGGDITITGQQIGLYDASLNVSGYAGGGTILIGGDEHGDGPLQQANVVRIGAATTLVADAALDGDGGQVVVWSQDYTRFAGLILAKGGPQGGNGGSAEISSHGLLDDTGFANLTAPLGTTGTLLLDPYDVVISSGTQANEGFSGGTYTPLADPSVINATTLDKQLASANVTIITGGAGSPGTDAGNITVEAPITWSSGSLLTLTAANAITIAAPITINGAGQLALNYSEASSASSPSNLSFGLTSTGSTGSVSYAAGTGEGIAGQALTINGQAYILLYSMSDIAAINGSSGDDALALGLTAPAAPYAGAVVGSFAGKFEGLGNSITGLAIQDASTTGNDGFFGVVEEGAQVADLNLVKASITSAGFGAGAVAGLNFGTITDVSSAKGSVTGGTMAGGLAGYNNGDLADVASTGGAVTSSTDSTAIGGLVGYNDAEGIIVTATASSSVHGSVPYIVAGGLVGANLGSIFSSSSSSAVTGGTSIGGLVGFNNLGAVITASSALGNVSGDAATQDAGGLAGDNDGTISGSVTLTGSVAGGYWAGGLVGLNDAEGEIDASSSSEFVKGDNGSTVGAGGLAGANSGIISGQSLATGSVTGGIVVGGVVGFNDGVITNDRSSKGKVYSSADTTALGGLVGYNTAAGSIKGSRSSETVDADSTYILAGGLVGVNLGKISFSDGIGFVTGGTWAGGLVGFNDLGAAITHSMATGLVTGGSATVGAGGLAGYNDGTIDHSVERDYGVEGGTWEGGLVGYNDTAGKILASSSVSSVGSDVAVAGSGGLVGANYGTISDGSFSTTEVGGAGEFDGGLVGYNDGLINGAYDPEGPNARFATDIGGLVGFNDTDGRIINSNATGGVQGANYSGFSGGLVGVNLGRIISSWASGSVSGGAIDGGLVGANDVGGEIIDSSASGAVYGFEASAIGGLVGDNSGAIKQSFATGAVSNITANAILGGLVGQNFARGTIFNTYSTGSVGAGSKTGGLVGKDDGVISASWTSSALADSSGVSGGLIGVLYAAPGAYASLSSLYWDEGATGQITGIGSTVGSAHEVDVSSIGGNTGLSTTQASTYGGFDFTHIWTIKPGVSPPTLRNAGS